MSIKHILVAVTGGDGDKPRLGAALALAERTGAGVAALHVMPILTAYAVGAGGEMPVALMEAQQKEAEERAQAIEAGIRAEAERTGVGVEWRCEEGEEAGHVGLHARYSDVVVASPDLARDLVFSSAAPVLAFPKAAPQTPPKHAMIAWNGSREAARAVHEVIPLIDGIEQVDVVVIDPPEGKPIGADLAEMLARHGFKVDVRERLSGGRDVGAILLEEAKTSGADLLVMGAYGRSRLSEWVLGGATETALNEATIPVLLAH